MEQRIPTRLAVRESGLSLQTLQDYARRGLITRPILGSYGIGGGRGTCYWWSANVAYQIALIKSYQGLGFTKDEISDILSGDIDHVAQQKKYEEKRETAKS